LKIKLRFHQTALFFFAITAAQGMAQGQDTEDKRTPVDKRTPLKPQDSKVTPNIVTQPEKTDFANPVESDTQESSKLMPDVSHGLSIATSVGVGGGKSKTVSFDRLSFNGQLAFDAADMDYVLKYQSLTSVSLPTNESLVHQLILAGVGLPSAISLLKGGSSHFYLSAGLHKSNAIRLDEDQVQTAKWKAAGNVTIVNHLPIAKNVNVDFGINASVSNFFWADAQVGISGLL
jgi:hypothetical protein